MNQRQEQILVAINRHGFLSREQINQIFDLRSKRNTNRVLSSIAPFVSSFRDGYETVYYLSKQGREWIGSDKIMKKTAQVKHFLMRNQYFIFQGCPKDWRVEIKISDGQQTNLVCDVVFNKADRFHFAEIDVTQSMTENARKIVKYKKMYGSGVYQKQFGYFPTVHFLTESSYRKDKLMSLLNGLPFQVFTYDEIK